MELHVTIPIHIFLDFSTNLAIDIVVGLLDLLIATREVVVHGKLGIGVHIDAHTRIERTHHPVAVPGLRLHEEAVRDTTFVERVARLGGVDVPMLIVFARCRDKITVFIAVVALVGVLGTNILIGLAPGRILEGVTDIDGREVGHREVAVGHALKGNTVGLHEVEAVVAVGILGLGLRELHRHTRRHLEGGIGNGPRAYHATILLLFDVVVVIARMNRIATSGVVHGHRQGVVFRALPLILTACASRLVLDIETGRGADILGVHDGKVLLAETLLTRLDVVQAGHRLLHVVEGDILQRVGVGVVGLGKGKVEILPTTEVIHRHRTLAQRTLRNIAHILQIEGIVDAEIGERRIHLHHMHTVVTAVEIPTEVRERTHRIVKEVAFERFFDTLLLLGRILLLGTLFTLLVGLLEGIRTVEVGILTALLGALQVTRTETLRPRRATAPPHEAAKQECYETFLLQHRFQFGQKVGGKITKKFSKHQIL